MKMGNVLFYAGAFFAAYHFGWFDNDNDYVAPVEEPAPYELAVHDEARKIINEAELIGRDYAWKHVKDDELHCLHAAGLVADNLLVKYNFGEEVNFKLKAAAIKECANVAKNNGFILKGNVFIDKDAFVNNPKYY